MIGEINRTRTQHIVTIEDPIEILHADDQCIVNQREVGLDTESFGQALRRALRQDPDVILIGELRDAETAQTALQAAESGHLVLSTMHTVDAAETVGRMIEFFPEGKQQQIRSVMAGVLRGVVSQRLLPRVDGGRIAAVEVMVNNARIADLIRENKAEEIAEAIAEGAFFEMQTFTQSLIDLVVSGRVDSEVAANAATNRHDFLVTLEHSLKQQAADVRRPPRRAGRAPNELELARAPDRPAASRCSAPPSPLPSSSPLPAASRRAPTPSPRRAGVPSCCRAPTAPNAAGSLAPPLELDDAAAARRRSALSGARRRSGSSAGAAYGIPWQVLAAINKIESNFGRNMGPSSAGAVGWMQFMPDTWLRWGTDANGDGVADPWNPEDAVYSAARYLAAAGGAADIARGGLRLQPRRLVRRRGARARARLRPGRRSGDARRSTRCSRTSAARSARSSQASEALTAALKDGERAAQRRGDLLADVDATKLLSERLAGAEARDARGRRAMPRSRRESTRCRGVLAQAELALARRTRALAGARASHRRPRRCSAAPSYSGDYVFPVGGGPQRRLRRAHPPRLPGRRHRRARGLAALRARERASSRRLALRRALRDRLHDPDRRRPDLDVLPPLLPRPRSSPGRCSRRARPSGSSARPATRPARTSTSSSSRRRSYPQDEAWFQSFAGTAFQWQGDPPALAAGAVPRSGDVFAPAGEAGPEYDLVFFNR